MGEKQMAEKEKKKDFVSLMLEKASEKDTPQPNVINEDPKQIEQITENIKRRLREG